jgi:hypothetical protein
VVTTNHPAFVGYYLQHVVPDLEENAYQPMISSWMILNRHIIEKMGLMANWKSYLNPLFWLPVVRLPFSDIRIVTSPT